MTRQELEDEWRRRLTDSRLRLQLAQNYVREVHADRRALPAPDGDYAWRRALRMESLALKHYRNVLKIFTDFVVRGKIPEEPQGSRINRTDAPASDD